MITITAMPVAQRPANRRKFRRLTIEPVLALVDDSVSQRSLPESWPPLVSEDISPDGVFLQTSSPWPVGRRVRLQLHLPTMTAPLTCEAQVARLERRLSGELRGIGVRFVRPSEGFLQQLVEHLYRSYQAQHAGQ